MTRNDFLKSLGALTLGFSVMELKAFVNSTSKFKKTELMPALFIGHGSPMNAIKDNNFTKKLAEIGQNLPKPTAIMVVSAHWLTNGTFVGTTAFPKTIHDFGGFPEELFSIQYPASGEPTLARQVALSIKSDKFIIHEDNQMGLDHGSWTILKHMYPKADVPVFQLSIDYGAGLDYHYELASYLQYLREKGVLIIGSGNVVHNLRMLNWQDPQPQPYDWAIEFDQFVKNNLDQDNHQALINYMKISKIGHLAHPSNDHYLPLMYTIGLKKQAETITHLYEHMDMGSISMRCFLVN